MTSIFELISLMPRKKSLMIKLLVKELLEPPYLQYVLPSSWTCTSSFVNQTRFVSESVYVLKCGSFVMCQMSPSNYERRDMSWMKPKFSQQPSTAQPGKRPRKGVKRLRRTVAMSYNGAVNSESESEEEEDAGGIHLGSMVSVETPEEKRRRQSRTKRFDKSKELSATVKNSAKAKGVSGGTTTARRATALQLAMSAGDGNGRAVEDIDWDSLTVRGTCQEVEKRYLRLTSAPDPSTVSVQFMDVVIHTKKQK